MKDSTRVTRHHKRANHSWLRCCSQEIIGLTAARLLERVSFSSAETEKLHGGIFSGAWSKVPAVRFPSCLLLSASVSAHLGSSHPEANAYRR